MAEMILAVFADVEIGAILNPEFFGKGALAEVRIVRAATKPRPSGVQFRQPQPRVTG